MFLRSRYGSAALILVLGSCTASQAISKDVPTPNDVGPRPAPSLDAAAPPPTFLPRRTLRPSQREATRAPVSLTASDGTGLTLVSLTARAVVEEPLAFTELHLVFENPTDRRIEGRFEEYHACSAYAAGVCRSTGGAALLCLFHEADASLAWVKARQWRRVRLTDGTTALEQLQQ